MTHPEVILDVRGLPAPEPLEHCLEALAGLEREQSLTMLIDREPFPLYAILDRHGFRHRCTDCGTHFQLVINKA
ncbi:DUF2249 domain-containing protein [Alcaligenes sp. SDU_A2]|uniref:DUF2249 domain-containing protein n=1 Tax=Alcaligenes sp. SDU_A2 TaxID=3136634 RepID=UPI00311F1B84